MQPHRFTEEELKLTLSKYPNLKQESDGELIGYVDINHQFGDSVIVDKFLVSIKVDDEYPESFPQLTEIGGRTKQIANKHKVESYLDLHCYSVNDPGIACVCAPQEKRRKFPIGANLCVYMDNLVVPYLYGLSYFEKFKKWPWGERSHGVLGPLEAYAEIESPSKSDITETLIYVRRDANWIEYHKQLKSVNPNKNCPCKSGKPFAICHNDAFEGLKKLEKDIKAENINVKMLFDIISNKLKNNALGAVNLQK